LELVERWNLPWPAGYAAVVLSWARAIEGDPVDAIPALRGQLARTEAGGTQHLVGWGLGLLAEAHLRNDQPVEALHLLDDALARVARTGERSYESELHRLRALSLAALAPPRSEEARSALRQAAAVAREQGSAMLLRRAAETCRTVAPDGHSGSRDHPDPQP
jgi:predicted ATPase